MALEEKLFEALTGVQHELRLSREQREQQQHVHVHVQPRVSFDTVLLALAAAVIGGSVVAACVQ